MNAILAQTQKIDYRKKYHQLYSPSSEQVEEIEVPPMQFAMIDGQGAPEGPEASPEFQNAIAALFGVTYTLKFSRKQAGVVPDYTISPLEGLWWMKDGADFDSDRPGDWRWTLMIFQPEFITPQEFNSAIGELNRKKPNPSLDHLHLSEFDEGNVVQITHIGPYAEEKRSIDKMEAYCKEHGYVFAGKHHEIYLGDPRRAKPDKLKTILRHPIQ